MKKILVFLFSVLLITASAVMADEIVDSKGVIIPCKIETISGGLVEYHKDGNLHYFEREKDQPIFNDYVDVRTKWFTKKTIQRQSGKILYKDSYGLRLRNENGDIDIPWYRVKFVGVYKP